ncbi:hypothetical protein CXG81DRAFT_17073 [Caulochytrium protostelioides]|uniref:Transmembrane 9 superfamily member n=1 Tax=Caulochytrium protostelioides TaxID=1555241 RepID=A0A4P9XDC4_9FUNG|nr:hypothetical protein CAUPRSCDRAFT_9651 [Caulochytrium protostelioides]RKP03453.1 hypothetical protein CXG81DRAFT_17073 [Caulochytrium protostelioides]|eukprot:RKP03453.1 hypothetical protein CXG81DRAFT_17073 [Caulochytrium protostelioides]
MLLVGWGALVCMASLLLPTGQAFYLPGQEPISYAKGERVRVTANTLTSSSSLINYDYDFKSFHFCPSEGAKTAQGASLGSVLKGDRLVTAPYAIDMLTDAQCKLLCEPVSYNYEDRVFLKERIMQHYSLRLDIDNLPVGERFRLKSGDFLTTSDFPLGSIMTDAEGVVPTLHNHLVFLVEYNTVTIDGQEFYRVVGATVHPTSRRTLSDDCQYGIRSPELAANVVKSGPPVILSTNEESKDEVLQVQYSYNVHWIRSETPWSQRWNSYLRITAVETHWFSLLNSAAIVLFLGGLVFAVLIRALHKDIARYNSLPESAADEFQEDFGWKLVHGDVFRTPKHAMFLSVLAGIGTQMLAVVLLTLLFAMLGVLSPSSRGSFSTLLLCSFVFGGSIGGYVSARLYKMFGRENWKRNIFFTAVLFPGLTLLAGIVINFFSIGAKSSTALPFGTVVALICMWLFILVPLTCLGAYIGFRKERISYPVRTNQIPRQIPQQPVYLRFWPSVLLGGILPFGAVFIELSFILASIWGHRFFYETGFLFLVFCITLLTCSQVTVLLTYFQLTSEDYGWWWRSFMTSGSCAFYVFLYSTWFYFSVLTMSDMTSTLIYFALNLMLAFVLFVLMGTVGFFASLWSIRRIYASIKID